MSLDKRCWYCVCQFLNFNDLVNAAVALLSVRAIVKEDEFRFWYLRVRHGLENDHQLDPDTFFLLARRCVKHMDEECQLDPDNALAFLDGDAHRAEHERTTLFTGVWCDHCAVMDPRDVRRLHAQFFNLYPLAFERRGGSHIAAHLFNVFDMFIAGPFYTPSTYGQFYIPAYRTCNPDLHSAEQFRQVEESNKTVFERGLLIPTWFLQKYWNYFGGTTGNRLCDDLMRRANPGRQFYVW